MNTHTGKQLTLNEMLGQLSPFLLL